MRLSGQDIGRRADLPKSPPYLKGGSRGVPWCAGRQANYDPLTSRVDPEGYHGALEGRQTMTL